jgi:hypothetical protein
MKPLFKTQKLQDEFDKNGFVRVPLLTHAQADNLLRLYKTIESEHQKIGLPFTTTSHSNNHELIRKADTQIAGIFAPELDKLLCDYELLFGNYLVKQPGADSGTPLHQDTTFVDETKFPSVSIWVSLQNTDKRNGCMRFIKGSHKFKFILRPTHAYPWPFEELKTRLEQHLTDYPSGKGEAFIFHHAIIHASYPNLTTVPRIAAVIAAYPKSAELLLLFPSGKSSTSLDKYKMTKEAYLHFIKGQPPAMGEFLESVYSDFEAVTPEEFNAMVPVSSSFRKKFGLRLSDFKLSSLLNSPEKRLE